MTEVSDFLAALSGKSRGGHNAHHDHKSRMLCKQVARALSMTLGALAMALALR